MDIVSTAWKMTSGVFGKEPFVVHRCDADNQPGLRDGRRYAGRIGYPVKSGESYRCDCCGCAAPPEIIQHLQDGDGRR